MAFDTQEQAIIKFGLQNGKSKEQVQQALVNYRTGVKPSAPKPVEQAGPSYLQRVGEQYSQAGKNIISGIQKGADDLQQGAEKGNLLQSVGGLLRSGLRTAGNVAGAAFAPITAAIEPVVKPALESAMKVPQIKDAFAKANELAQKHPEIAKDLQNILDITTLGAGGAGEQAVKDVTAKGLEAGGKLATEALNTSDAVVAKTKDLFSKATAKINNEIVPISENVQTTLKRVDNSLLKKYIDQAKLASSDAKLATPLEVAGDRATEALDTVQRKLSNIGAEKANILNSASVSNKPMGTVALEAKRNILRDIPKTLDATDSGLVQDITDQLSKLGTNPSLKQMDEFVDYAQGQLWKSKQNLAMPVSGKVEGLLKNSIRQINDKVKAVAPSSYTTLNDAYANIIETRNSLNKALGYDANKGGALLKKVFSPTDSGTKKLFADVKKLTNIDLTDEAVLAKFAMELFGDTRQASLLQQLSIPTQKGVLEKALQIGGKAAGLDEYIKNLTIQKAQSLTK
jgi:hypothetical protein